MPIVFLGAYREKLLYFKTNSGVVFPTLKYIENEGPTSDLTIGPHTSYP